MKKIAISNNSIIAVTEETSTHYFGSDILSETFRLISKKSAIEATSAILELIRDEKAIALLCAFMADTNKEAAVLMGISLRQYMRKRDQYLNCES